MLAAIGLLLVLLVLNFFPIADKSSPVSMSSGADVFQPHSRKNEEKKSVEKPKKPALLDAELDSEAKTEHDNLKQKDKTFLQAFRDFYFFLGCKTAIQGFFEKKNYDEIFGYRIGFFEKNGVTDLALHKQYFQQYTQKCQDKLSDADASFEQAVQRQKDELFSIEAKIQDEKDLLETLNLLETLHELQQEFKSISAGENTLSKAEIDSIRAQIQQLYDANRQLNALETTEDVRLQIQVNKEKIKGLNKILRSQTSYDKDKMSSLNEQVKLTKSLLFEQLKIAQLADVHLLIFRSNYPRKNYKADLYRDIGDLMKNHAETVFKKPQFHSNYGNILSRSALPLFACALNYPCDGDSVLAWELCIHSGLTSACGKPVEDFLLDDYISPNAQMDVQAFLTHLLNTYAQAN